MDMNLIQSNSAVMMGKPVIAGTRITVELILEKLGAGETIEQLLEAHPRLTREAIFAALTFATQTQADQHPTRNVSLTILASEDVLSQDWSQPEEDAAWQ